MILRSTAPSVVIPDMTVYELLFADLDESAQRTVAVVDGSTGRSWTYGGLVEAIDAFAGALAARGVQPGDVVALHSPNSPEFVIAFHGLLRAGATVTSVNALYTPAEIAVQLRDSGATRYLTVTPLLTTGLAACTEVGIGAESVFLLDLSTGDGAGHETLAAMVIEGWPAPEVVIDPAVHLAVLPYSSGTTGRAKGVMLTHRNLVANICQLAPMLPITAEDVALAVLPFFHIYGMNVIMNLTLHGRGRIVTLPRMDLSAFLGAIADHECTRLFIAPPVAVALTKDPLVDQFDLSSVRSVVCGAAPLDEALGTTLRDKLGCRLMQGFGMTELSPVSHVVPLNGRDLPVGSIGIAIPNIEFKLVDPETGATIAPVDGGLSRPGELQVRGPNVMVGYLGNPHATAETIDAEGFLHTGDIAQVGTQGEVYIVDRLKELIKYKGYQVPPAELEALLLTHPAIADAAVVAHPDQESGEVPRAFVVRQPQVDLSATEVIAYVAERVAPHKKVRLVEFIAEIPKSPSGKILRKNLRNIG